MKLIDLSPKQLDRLERAARQELERRARRRSAAAVRQLLDAAAAEAGYTLDEVFPEFTQAGRARREERTDAGSKGDLTSAGKVIAELAPEATAPALDLAQQVVRTLATQDPMAVGLSQSLDAVRASMGMQNWQFFHAAMEEAARRNWLHFRGNDQCVLTEEGLRRVNSDD